MPLPRRRFRPTADAASAPAGRQPMTFSGIGGQSFGAYTYGPNGVGALGTLGGLLPGAKKDWSREVGHVHRNSVVAVCLGWIADVMGEADPIVTREGPDGPEPVANHPLVRLLRRPNPHYSGRTLLAATALSYKCDGNAYWVKSRGSGGFGAPLQLWYVPHWQMFPQWPAGPTTEFISHYKYVVDGRVIPLDPSEVVHFRDGIDPLFPRLGLGRLKSLLRSLVSLNEAETFTASILQNMGVPALAIIPDGDNSYEIDETEAQAIKQMWRRSVTGEDRGEPWVPSLKVKIEKLGLTPEELALDRCYQVPLQLVCAALKVSPHVVGLEMGPSGFDSGGQRQEARKAAYEDCVIPMLSALADDGFQTQLLPDLGDPETETAGWDFATCPALREDQEKVATRATGLFGGGLARRNEARSMVGLKPLEGPDGEAFAPGYGPEARPAAPTDPEPGDTGDTEPDPVDPGEADEQEPTDDA